ncbi:penicillin-binding transpeptidase domain-containing protein [Paenibacillus tarimensis]|uniref:penicillin-binding transpeptidase domain-containing protein n=1 Tax=Paenibacillus tarimensis TaxID=416012 RepID=UPI001F2D575C|nr:penicillin-binding transpeptidase domain-containing protein [Paenibacillus tarimensis]MCF2942109.1 PASTA domain-containing protein [Paenibacillus tarimensis]
MTKRIKLRTLLIGGIMTLLFVVLLGRVYFVQVVNADLWYERAKNSWAAFQKIPAVRGTITDRNGNVLAMDVAGYTVAVNPEIINKLGIADQVVYRLHTLLGKKESELREAVTKKNEEGEYYRHRELGREGKKLDKEMQEKIVAFREELQKATDEKDVGIYLIEEQKRYYPKQDMASHLLGYVNKEGEAVTGMELSLNEELAGTDGKLVYERDGRQVQLSNGEVEYVPAKDGKDVTLTIDTEIQYYVEKAIKEAYDKYKPKSITAIAADPNTMEILGMANYPDYNPNEYWTMKPGSDYNYAVRALLEPGSTFKMVTLAAAVEEGVFNPDEIYKSGSRYIGGWTLNDHKRGGWGPITFLEGLKRSSNVAFIELGYNKMSTETLMKYITAFGFGAKTGLEVGGESTGMVKYRYESEKATLTYGQGTVQVTPIQQVAAIAAIANGGKLMQPHLIKEIEDPVTGKKEVVQPKVVRQVISEKTAGKVGEYLEQVVSDQEIGTGKNAYIEGYRVAGKTGTAQKVTSSNKSGYADDKYIVSFIGYAPVEDPRIVVYVVADEPEDSSLGGGTVAAPVFKDIVEQSLRYMRVTPSNAIKAETDGRKDRVLTAPELTGLKVSEAKSELKANAMTYEVVGSGTTVLQQVPKPGTAMASFQRIYLITEERSKLPVPNVRGLSLRDALEVCSLLEMRCITEGEGFVKSQMVAKQQGERVFKLVLEPPGEAIVKPEPAEPDGAAARQTEQTGGEADTAGETSPPSG